MTTNTPTSTNAKIAVAGATGRLGRHVVAVLGEQGYDVVPMSRTHGVDVVSGEGLDAALAGVDLIVDVATSPSPDEAEATAFFTAATRNLHEAGRRAGVRRTLVVSIVGTDGYSGGYGAAKIAHERAALAGPLSTRILRATQFHEFVEQLLAWGTQGEVAYVQEMRTQPIAARSVAEAVAGMVAELGGPAVTDIAGPREESMVDLAALLASRRGLPVRVEGVTDPTDPDSRLAAGGGLLPGPGARLAGPTFEDWLETAWVPAQT
jgi:uncharacterized protein YbjT (DUF2867 family)